MKYIKELISFLNELEERNIFYKIAKHREDAIMIEVVVPGERWEIELVTYESENECQVEIERFRSDGEISDENALSELFALFSE